MVYSGGHVRRLTRRRPAVAKRGASVSKQIQSTVLLFLIGTGFLIFSLWSLTHLPSDDRAGAVVQALLYMVPSVAAFGALIMLPRRQDNS